MTDRLHIILDAERRIELLQGRVQVGGNQRITRLVLAQLLAQASVDELRILGREGWQDAAPFVLNEPPISTGDFNHRRHYSLLQRLSMPLFDLLKGTALTTFSRDIVVWLGESALTPDVFVGFGAAMREYYLEVPPLLAIEIVDPYNVREELGRLSVYGAAGTPEVWWLEPQRQLARQFVLQGRYTLRTQTTGWLERVGRARRGHPLLRRGSYPHRGRGRAQCTGRWRAGSEQRGRCWDTTHTSPPGTEIGRSSPPPIYIRSAPRGARRAA